MGGKSSSKSTTNNTYTTTNVSGTSAASGDNNGLQLSGVNNSTINATITDHGAVNKALTEMFNVTDEALDFGEVALTKNENIIDKALNFASKASNGALDVAKNLSLDSDAATARETNKNMMYTTVAIAVALGIMALKSK
ncbi:hypothetical protein [Vibrio hepatarius]|uniref:hypothetical protein n=1 Tax=Vibrio hepatarius TaxID=171383 RepID=UPI00148CD8F5|nr:hypothetical protein [Vibrio hepatarius]NOI13806.1 hypothetical protein [Vibrio hepatarius]